jgi:hypothetical protein
MDYIHKMFELANITMGDNPRLPTTLDLPPLVQSISDVGLLEPLTVWIPNGDNNIVEVIKGHRRCMALQELSDHNPKRFKELFPEGIPTFVRENITAKEATVLKLDHGAQVSLSHPHELQMSANQLFGHKATQAEVANLLRPLIDKISPPPAKKRQEFTELQEAIDEAKDAKGRAKAEKALYERIAEYHRGRVQNLFDVYRCPDIVEAALYFKACGERRKGYEKEYLPALTQKQVNSLWKGFSEDLKITEEGVPTFNSERPGPEFTAKWSEICKAEQEKEPKTPKAKAMSANDMKSEIGTRWASKGFCKLTNWHGGDKTVEGLDEHDKAYHGLDLVITYAPELAAMVVEESEKIKKQLVDADKEAGSEAKAEDAS